jgi:hypothetical protein
VKRSSKDVVEIYGQNHTREQAKSVGASDWMDLCHPLLRAVLSADEHAGTSKDGTPLLLDIWRPLPANAEGDRQSGEANTHTDRGGKVSAAVSKSGLQHSSGDQKWSPALDISHTYYG